MPKFEDILFTELETEDIKDVSLAEGIFPMNPLLAFYTFKRNSLKNLKTIKGATIGKVAEKGKRTKAELKKGGEKLKSALDSGGGKDPDSTVYRLTRKQEEVLSSLHEKHGPKFIQELMDFRTGVLGPYQVIKRTVKKNKMLTAKEPLGMTKEQFKSAVESGRRKIEARGSRFEKFDDLKSNVEKQERSIKALEQVKAGIKTNKQIPPTILERILKEYDLGKKEFQDYSMNDLKKAYFVITKNVDRMGEIGANDEGDELTKAQEINALVKTNIKLRKGQTAKEDLDKRMKVRDAETDEGGNLKEDYLYEYSIDLTKNKNFRMSNGGFNSALGLYFLRKEIIKQLKPEKRDSIYRQTYVKIVDQLINDAKKRKTEASTKIVKNKGSVEFNERERKIWELRPSVKTQSGEIKDYVQKLKEEDFFNPKYFKKSEKLTSAEKKVEAGIKRFERSLKKRISPEEYKELKKYRLINNLITVGEMKSPEKLFKSQEELQSEIKTAKRDFLSDGEFETKMREIYYLTGLMDCMINQVNPVLRTDLLRNMYKKVFLMKEKLNVHWRGPLDQVLLPIESDYYDEFEYRSSLSRASTLKELYIAINRGTNEMFDVILFEYVFYCPSTGE